MNFRPLLCVFNLLFRVQIFSCCYKTVLSHFVDDGVYASYTDFLTAAMNNDSAFALCSYTTVFHV